MGKESAKNKDGQWFAVEKAVVVDEQMEMGEIDGQRAVLRENLYDRDGNRILMVVEMPMDEIPLPILEQFRRALTVQNLTQIMLIPPQVRFMRLRKMSDFEVRRLKDESREPAPKLPPPSERKILVP